MFFCIVLFRNGTLDVHIHITDANDNAPRFNQLRYVTDIIPNVTLGYSVIVVKASDSDQGENAKIRYTLHNVSDRKSFI